ncbi:MAG: hypothetical protein HY287_03020 [Planctomycetes bacterium]|nr:hypothetical protein [Planctomycetota bacterium]
MDNHNALAFSRKTDKELSTMHYGDIPSAGPWPAELDALVAAPKQHRLLLENAAVRVLDMQIATGECTPVHTHQWPAVHYVLSWSAFVRRHTEGNIVVDSRVSGSGQCPPAAFWGEPLGPHSLEIVGPAVLHVMSVELKTLRVNAIS